MWTIKLTYPNGSHTVKLTDGSTMRFTDKLEATSQAELLNRDRQAGTYYMVVEDSL